MREALGCLPLAHHPVRQRVGSPAVPVVEHSERLGVAPSDEGDQILVRKEQVLSLPIRHSSIVRQSRRVGSIMAYVRAKRSKLIQHRGVSVEAL